MTPFAANLKKELPHIPYADDFRAYARSGITSDPNRCSDDPQYIIKLVQRVVTVSVETAKLVDALPDLSGDD